MAVGYGIGHAIEIKLTEAEREELRSIVRRSSEPAGLVRRARVVQLSDEGVSGREIALRLDLSPEHVSVIRSRFRAEGVPGLAERPSRVAQTTRFRRRRRRASCSWRCRHRGWA